MKPEPVKDIVAKVFQGIKQTRGKGIAEVWEDIAGRQLARHSRPVGLQSGTLIVNVDAAVWLHELNLCKPVLVRRIKKTLSGKSPDDIRFRIGAV